MVRKMEIHWCDGEHTVCFGQKKKTAVHICNDLKEVFLFIHPQGVFSWQVVFGHIKKKITEVAKVLSFSLYCV